ncbi:MAG TPA: hypothetical protein VFC07_11330 [Verrucomicrobiae bacterium]|nr:hypothetical protein [Verrucomicrobiae bacterium]
MKKGQGWAKRVTIETLPSFASYLRSAEEREANQKRFVEEVIKKTSASGAPSPFQGVSLNYPNRFSKRPKPTVSKTERSEKAKTHSKPTGEIFEGAAKGNLIWRKRLNRSDAQQTSAGTNPTGCLRFTQARKDNPTVIDQTTFFRKQLFGNFQWREIKKNPYEEATQVPFHITINGKDLGESELQVRHKPSGEAGQGNYTTSLHWGKRLTAQIRDSVSAGEMFALYAPTQGSQSPFFIEIS